MIPQIDNSDELLNFDIKQQPSRTYKVSKHNVNGICDNLEAIKQAIYLILNIERYEYAIYSHDYGVEFNDLFGQPKSYAIPEIERRIKEALEQDDRIESVDNFKFESKKGEIHTYFTVHSSYGSFDAEKGVKV